MRIPKSPPGPDKTSVLIGSTRLLPMLDAVPGPSVNGKYLHWDQLRFRTPPTDLSLVEWWAALTFRRSTQSRPVPLLDSAGKCFSYLTPDPVPELLHKIDQGAGGFIEMPDQITNPQTKDRYYVSSLIQEAITSSQLEGATTTREIAKEMLRAGRPPRDRSERMILNNFLTMRRIGELKHDPLTPELVHEIHRLVTDQALDDPSGVGRYRYPNERIVVTDNYGTIYHEPPPADQLAQRVEEMCAFANGETPGEFIHPVIRSIILHFWLAYDHPFTDGNGRTARALFYWSMLRHGFWLCEFVSISTILVRAPIQYGRAFLYTETDRNDLTYFVLFHLDVIRRAVKELHDYINRKAEQVQKLESQVRGSYLLNHRQSALISHALRHPNQQYTIESHRVSHAVVYQTARTDLMELVDRDLLSQHKVKKRLVFVPVPDLEERLSRLGR